MGEDTAEQGPNVEKDWTVKTSERDGAPYLIARNEELGVTMTMLAPFVDYVQPNKGRKNEVSIYFRSEGEEPEVSHVAFITDSEMAMAPQDVEFWEEIGDKYADKFTGLTPEDVEAEKQQLAEKKAQEIGKKPEEVDISTGEAVEHAVFPDILENRERKLKQSYKKRLKGLGKTLKSSGETN